MRLRDYIDHILSRPADATAGAGRMTDYAAAVGSGDRNWINETWDALTPAQQAECWSYANGDSDSGPVDDSGWCA